MILIFYFLTNYLTNTRTFVLQTCAHTQKPPINTSTFASIFYLGTQFPKPHVPKCIKPTFLAILFLPKKL